MKKSLIALSVLAAFSGAAMAQVTTYGRVDIGLTSDKTSDGSTTRITSGNQSGSRVGFKGTEDLGGGLNALFQLEMGVAVDTGDSEDGSRTFRRQALAGLGGSFGSITLGRQYAPVFVALDTIDPLATGLVLGGVTGVFDYSNTRINNSLIYSSPTIGGLSGTLAMGFGEETGKSSAGSINELSVNYANGPLTVVLAYSKSNTVSATGNETPTKSEVVGGLDAAKVTMVGGTYNFGMATLHAAFGSNKGAKNKSETTNGVTTVSTPAVDTRSEMIGVTVPVGSAGAVVAEYVAKTDKANLDAKTKMTAIAYTHSLSARTNLYAAYGDISVTGQAVDTTQFNVGIRHKF